MRVLGHRDPTIVGKFYIFLGTGATVAIYEFELVVVGIFTGSSLTCWYS